MTHVVTARVVAPSVRKFLSQILSTIHLTLEVPQEPVWVELYHPLPPSHLMVLPPWDFGKPFPCLHRLLPSHCPLRYGPFSQEFSCVAIVEKGLAYPWKVWASSPTILFPDQVIIVNICWMQVRRQLLPRALHGLPHTIPLAIWCVSLWFPLYRSGNRGIDQ